MANKEKVFPLHTFGGRIQNLRISSLKISRPEFYDLIRPNENIQSSSKERVIKDWESGSHLPDLETIAKICSVLGCSSDYLLGLDECVTKTDQFIHDQTGLSEKSIRQLCHLNTYPQGKVRLAIIDYFLSNQKFSLVLTDIINDYYMTLVSTDNFEKEYLAGYEKEINTAIPCGPVQRRKDAAEAKHFRILKQFDDVIEKLVKHFREKNQQI